MDVENANIFTTKVESGEDVKTENFWLDIPKLSANENTELKPKLLVEIESQEIENAIIDHSYCKIIDTSLYTVTKPYLMDVETANSFVVKVEPGEESVGIENFSYDITKLGVNEDLKLKPELAVEIEKQAIENAIIDHSYYKVIDTSLYKCKGLCPNKIEPLVKIENGERINESEQVYEIRFANWAIKNELDVKEEDFEPMGNSMLPECVIQDKHEVYTDIEYQQNFSEGIQHRNLENHSLQYSKSIKDNMLKCNQCDYQTNRGYRLKIHLLRHKNWEEVELMQCDRCEFQTTNEGSLKRHLLLHPDDGFILKCEYCQYTTSARRNLNRHLRRHNSLEENERFKCDQCNFKTYIKNSLKMHLLRHMNPEEVEMFKCQKCHFQTIYKANLKYHLLQHENPDNVDKFKCNQCGFETIHKKSLRNHLLRHANPEELETFECYQCQYKTIYKRVLKKHLHMHKNPKENVRFKCDQCDYQTFEEVNFKNHHLRHTSSEKVEVFKCHKCQYQTIRENCLKLHIIRHKKKVETFKCHQCRYKTTRKDTLRKHILRHMKLEKGDMLKYAKSKLKKPLLYKK